MKKSIYIIFLVFTFFTYQSNAQTTIEEYNYVTKGYKIQLESGLDMKKGYQIQYMDTVLTSERSVTLSKLIKTTNKK